MAFIVLVSTFPWKEFNRKIWFVFVWTNPERVTNWLSLSSCTPRVEAQKCHLVSIIKMGLGYNFEIFQFEHLAFKCHPPQIKYLEC